MTSPATSTVATEGSLLDQSTLAFAITLSLASVTVAVILAVSPGPTSTISVGSTEIAWATWATVTCATALKSSKVAVTDTPPTATALTSPAEFTVAMVGSLLGPFHLHVWNQVTAGIGGRRGKGGRISQGR